MVVMPAMRLCVGCKSSHPSISPRGNISTLAMRRRWAPLGWQRILGRMPVLLAAAGFLLVGLDGSLNIAFPAMAAAFHVDPTTIRWVIICYVGTYSVTAFAAGVLADRLGAGPGLRAGLCLSPLCFL